MRTRVHLPVTAAAATAMSALCLSGVFSSGRWVPAALLAVAVVVATCEALRRTRVPRAAVPVGGLAALVVLLVFVYASKAAFAGIVPTPAAVRALVALVRAGGQDVQQYAAPAPVTTALSLLTTAGIGAVALAVDTFAVTLRRAALAGAPLLALYSVPAAVVPEGVGWSTFAIGAAGFLALLLAESRERVAHWGRQLQTSRPGHLEGSTLGGHPLTALGRRVGVAAVALAVLVPVAVPGLQDGVLGNGRGFNGTGPGTSTVVVDNPMLSLKDDLARLGTQEVLRYRTDLGQPGYLRLVSLDEFSGDSWEPSPLRVPGDQRATDGLPGPPGLDPGVERHPRVTDIEIAQGLDTRWLPAPYAMRRVSIAGTWLYDVPTYNVYSPDTTTVDKRYRVESVDIEPTPAQLRDAPPARGMERFLALPQSLPVSVRETARRVTNGAPTAYDEALALQSWLRSDAFTYDTNAPGGSGGSAIEAFLTDRRGFCVHFASAMALMARSLGIPARVARGYLPGDGPDQDGYRVVRRDRSHAWPELYFEGVGWVPFEPTPATQTGAPPRYATPAAGAGSGTRGGPRAGAARDDSSAEQRRNAAAAERARRQRLDTAQVPAVPVPSATVDKGPTVPWPVAALAAAGVLALLLPMAARAAVRHRRWARVGRTPRQPATLADAAWDELRDTARDHGHAWSASATPRQAADRLATAARLDGDARTALARLARAAERARYARAMGDVGDLRADVAAVRAGLAATAPRWTRVRARLAPPSTLTLLHLAGERTADVLDGVDRSLAQVRVLPRALPRMLPRRPS